MIGHFKSSTMPWFVVGGMGEVGGREKFKYDNNSNRKLETTSYKDIEPTA